MRLFLSTPFRARDDDLAELLAFRRELKHELKSRDIELVLAEDETAGQVAGADATHIEIVSICERLIKQSDAFAALIFERHGSPLPFGVRDEADARSEVSIFETEMLVAVMRQKPRLLIRVEGFSLHAKLADFLALVEAGFPDRMQSRQTDIANALAEWTRALGRSTRSNGLVFDFLLRCRQARGAREEAKRPRFLFFDNVQHLTTSGTANLGAAQTSIEAARLGTDQAGKPMREATRLVLLWTAMRELIKDNSEEAFRERAELWREALGNWASRAAWAGLKGPFLLGELAAVNANFRIARQFPSEKRPPFGGRASALLGVVDYAQTQSERVHLLHIALPLVNEQIAGSLSTDPSGGYLIRSGLYRRLAKNGRPWFGLSALSDTGRAVRWRERNAASDSVLGEALFDHGNTWFELNQRRGLALMAKAVSLQENDVLVNRAGFLAGAKRKFAARLDSAGRHDEAGEQRAGANRLAETYGFPKV